MSEPTKKKIDMEEAKRISEEYEHMREQFEMCKRCWMSTYTGNGWYCPLPYCEREDRYV